MNRPARHLLRAIRWQITALTLPLVRVVSYLAGVTPSSLGESLVARPVQETAIIALGVAALVSLVGTVAQKPIVERSGLQLLVFTSLAYVVILAAAGLKDALPSIVFYVIIAGASADRSTEITHAMRTTNRVLLEERR